jgi:hypothetical protein
MPNRIVEAKGSTHATIFPPSLRPTPTRPLAGAKAASTQVPVGWVCLQPDDLTQLAVLAGMGDDAWDLVDGFGGIATAARPGDEALTWWEGTQNGVTATGEIVLEDPEHGRPIDDLYDNLEALAGRGRNRLPGEPPKLIVDTAGLFRHDVTVFPDVRWWIRDLAWSKDTDDQETDADGHRLRAVASLTLIRVVEPDALRTRALSNRLKHLAKTKSKTGRQPYIVKDGETLITVAAKKLGDPGRWRELAALNGIRDPLSVKPGASITLP